MTPILHPSTAECNTHQSNPQQCVYLLHFDKPLSGHARHYLGWTVNLERRLAMHRRGAGARLPQVVQQAGILIMLARVWDGGDRALERRLKGWHNSALLCPICQAAAQAAKGHNHAPEN